MADENVAAGNSNTAEETVLETAEETTTEETVEEEAEESVEELKARLAKAEEYGKNQKIRAEKAEKGGKPEKVISSKPSLSTSDLYALVKAEVPEEDISEVEEYAQFKKISVAEALKSSVVKSLLSEKAEKRNVATATSVGNSRRGSAKVSDEALVANASAGKLPESDEEITRLLKTKMGIKK